MTSPVCVSEASLVVRAMPKSVSFTCPSWRTRMLEGFTSRWTMPWACAAASAEAAWASSGAAWSAGSGPFSRIRPARVVPSTCSITSHW